MTLPADIDDRSFRGRDEARPMSRDALHRAWRLLSTGTALASATRPECRRSDDVNAVSWQAVRPYGRWSTRGRAGCTSPAAPDGTVDATAYSAFDFGAVRSVRL